jgi:D-beta-D-heptose 7-phosphate kinase / D-beta-D-heptose 1-phosphate adenosyltransferase
MFNLPSKKIKDLRIAILGDIMLDKYINGYCERVSPEAPVPVVKAENSYNMLGGAGNVAANLNGLGANVCPIGVIGNDENGQIVQSLYSDINSEMRGIYISENACTTTKTRIIANGQQVVRVDYEDVDSNRRNDDHYIKNNKLILGDIDLIIISDYGKGSCSQKVIYDVINECNNLGKPILIDPRKSIANFDDYKYCTIITPNFYETKSLLPEISNTDVDIEKSAEFIAKQYNIDNVIITRGSSGLSVMSKGNPMVHLSTEAKEVFDVSGAGDTVIATIGVCVAAGFDLIQSAKIANVAAGIVVSHRGTTPIKFNELNERLNQQL